jgi:hypothetical protein
MATTDDVLARVRAEEREDRELVRGLTPVQWKWAQSYGPGLPEPGPNASQDELRGWQAYIRCYTRRPVFVEEELTKLKRKMAQWRNE